MRNVAKTAFGLLLLGATAWVGVAVIAPALKGRGKQAPKAPVPPPLPDDVRALVETGSGRQIRDVLERHRGTPHSRELERLAAKRSGEVQRDMLDRLGDLLVRFRYRSAIEMLAAVKRDWAGYEPGRLAAEKIRELREEQQEQVDSRKRESEAMLEAGRREGALETLVTAWELEQEYRDALDALRIEMQRRLDIPTAPPAGATPPLPGSNRPEVVVRSGVPQPPALPGYPHPDVKRLGEARAAIAKAKRFFEKGRHASAVKTLEELLGYYADLAYVKRNREAADAMALLSAYQTTKKPTEFFHATKVSAKGRSVTLTYEFSGDREHLDWVEERTLPYQNAGQFEPARQGVRGTGGMSYLHRGFFENNVSITCEAKISQPKSHGLAFCQAGNELRQLVLLATNHRIVEGENYVKPRPGHSVLMFGKGTNNDVPVDAPDIGFIFKGDSKESPAPPADATIHLSFAVKGDNMVGTVRYGKETATLTYHTKGDDGRSIARLRPALFVIENGVVFRRIRIKGVLHPHFARERVEQLLNLIGTLE